MALRSDQLVLEIENLSVRRGNTLILNGISWRVAPGEHWVILGANGSGKTSLLSALTAYLTPTGGAIQLLGKRYGRANWIELRKEIGMVSSAIRQLMPPEEPALQSIISGKYAMIDFWGEPTAREKAEAKRILADIECEYLKDRPWIYLSQGERQRILIGRALMAKPRLLILDEPCAGLDPAAREHFLQFLERLGNRRDAPTLIFVTHHVEEIVPVFSHVLVLKGGRVLAAGPKMGTLTTPVLSKALDSKVRLSKSQGRYGLTVAPTSRVAI